MTIEKYKKILTPYLIIIGLMMVFIFITLYVVGRGDKGYAKVIPVPTQGTQSLWILIFTIIGSIVGAIVGGYILGPFFLFVHKKTIGRKMIYGFQNRAQSNKIKGVFFKALFPALLTVNLCLVFSANSTIQEITLREPETSMAQMLAFSVILPLITGVSMAIFSPTWFLLDAGIVYTNKKKVRDRSDPIEIRSVGGWYIYLMKGYAGVAVIISFYTFYTHLLSIESDGGAANLLIYIIWPFMPIFIAFMMVLGIIALDMTFNKRRKFIQNWAKRFGISEALNGELDLSRNN